MVTRSTDYEHLFTCESPKFARFQRLFRGVWRVTLQRNRSQSKQQTESEKAYEKLEAAFIYKRRAPPPPHKI